MNLAIISPSDNAYSETFIQKHKNIPGVSVYYYFDGCIPVKLERKGKVESIKLLNPRIYSLQNKFLKNRLTYKEENLLRSFKRNKIDCVLAEYGTTAVCLLSVCKKNSIPLIVHFHGYDASVNSILNKNRDSYRAVFNYADSIFVVSKVMKQKLVLLGCPESKLINNPYGPDDSFYQIQPEFCKKQFIGLGRFVDKKAPYYTIMAFNRVLKDHPDARLMLGGDGYLLNSCINLVRFLKIESSVIFTGAIAHEVFKSYLGESLAFVQHSITADNGDMEGTPVSMLEASSAGLPVIATEHAGIPDAIVNGETGFLVAEHDVEGMAKYMCMLLNDFTLAKKIGEKGKEHIRKNFSLNSHLQILSDVILKRNSV